MTERTYNEILKLAHEELKVNNIVILDASFSNKKYRLWVMKKFTKHKSGIYFLEVSAREKDIKKRLKAREHTPSVSDARFDLFERFKASYNKPDEIPKGMLYKTNPDKNIDENIKGLLSYIIKLS